MDARERERIEEAWAREVERRLRAIDAGSAKLEDWAIVHARILARLRARL